MNTVKEPEQKPAVADNQGGAVVEGASTAQIQLPVTFTPTDKVTPPTVEAKPEGKGVFSMGSLLSLFGKKGTTDAPSAPVETATTQTPEKSMDREALNETFRQNAKNYVPVKPLRAKPGYLMVQPIYPPTMQVSEDMRAAHLELSIAQVTEQRQKIAKGERLYARAIKRRPSVFDVNQPVGDAAAKNPAP